MTTWFQSGHLSGTDNEPLAEGFLEILCNVLTCFKTEGDGACPPVVATLMFIAACVLFVLPALKQIFTRQFFNRLSVLLSIVSVFIVLAVLLMLTVAVQGNHLFCFMMNGRFHLFSGLSKVWQRLIAIYMMFMLVIFNFGCAHLLKSTFIRMWNFVRCFNCGRRGSVCKRKRPLCKPRRPLCASKRASCESISSWFNPIRVYSQLKCSMSKPTLPLCEPKRSSCKLKGASCQPKRTQSITKRLPCEPKYSSCKPKHPPCEPKSPPCTPRRTACESRRPSMARTCLPCEPRRPPCESQRPSCESRRSPCESRQSSCESRQSPCESRQPTCEPSQSSMCQPWRPLCPPKSPPCKPQRLICKPQPPVCEEKKKKKATKKLCQLTSSSDMPLKAGNCKKPEDIEFDVVCHIKLEGVTSKNRKCQVKVTRQGTGY